MKRMRIFVGAALLIAAWMSQASAQQPGYLYFGQFYVLADGGAAFSTDTSFRSVDPDSLNAVLGEGQNLTGNAGTSPLYNIGFGSQLTRLWRWDATLSYVSTLRFSGSDDFTTTGSVTTAKAHSLVGLLNGYFQIDGLFPPFVLGPFHPYLDAGIGAASNHISTLSSTALGGTIGGNTTTSAAFAIGAGVSWDVAPRLSLDLAYRLINLGELRTSSLQTVGGVTTTISPLRAFQDVNTLTLGLRFSL